MAEREGFEPSVRYAHTRFRVVRLRPLGHLSLSVMVAQIMSRRSVGWHEDH